MHSPPFDLTGDGVVDALDVDELVLSILGTLYGDANLDRTVDGLDFIQWNANKFQAGGWEQGDFSGDMMVDGTDFIIWNANKFQTAANLIGQPGSATADAVAAESTGTQHRLRLSSTDGRRLDPDLPPANPVTMQKQSLLRTTSDTATSREKSRAQLAAADGARTLVIDVNLITRR